MGYYSNKVLATLILMVVAIAALTLAVKVFFQLGYDDPFLVAVLYLLGQSLALPIYWCVQWPMPDADEGIDDSKSDADTGRGAKTEDATNANGTHTSDALEDVVTDEMTTVSVQERPLPALDRMLVHTESRHDSNRIAIGEDELEQDGEASRSTRKIDPIGPSTVEEESSECKPRRGSITGLTQQSQDAVQWVHKIPGWAKPLMSSFFNLLDVTFRMLAIQYLAASVATMLLGGMELIVSIFAARFVRKRHIARQRWYGAGIMTIGLVLVACSDLLPNDNSGSSSESLGLGILFVFLTTISSVSQNLTRELFIQEGKVSATWLLGMEGSSGLIMVVPLYFLIGPLAGYDPVESFRGIGDSSLSIGYTVGLILGFSFASMFSVLGTACTSSMSSNMWRNFSGLVVWIAALVIFYAVGDEDLGEPWTIR
jgi:drug/metabolite transporter (DMT)-like permease